MAQSEYQDFITYEVKPVIIIREEETANIMNESRYEAILIVLRAGPMTVKDLEENYNRLVAKDIDKMDLDAKDKVKLIEKVKRKSKTLYKYLDVLEKLNLVVQVGKRIRMGQTASETLYGRAAKLFLLSTKKETELSDKKVLQAMKVLAKIIGLEKGTKNYSEEQFVKFIDKLNKIIWEEKERIFNSYPNELAQLATDLSFEEISYIVRGLEIMAIISHAQKLEKDLALCYK